MSSFTNLSQLLALAMAIATSSSLLVASAPTPSVSPQIDDVGTLNCSLYASGTLTLVPEGTGASSVPLGLTDDSSPRFLAKFNNDGADPTAHATVEFHKCDSKFMGYKNSKSKKYGHIQVQASRGCLMGRAGANATATFIVNPSGNGFCSFSDDSSQVAQYWSFEPHGNDQPIIEYLGHREVDSYAGNQFRYALTSSNEVLGTQEGMDGSHLSFH